MDRLHEGPADHRLRAGLQHARDLGPGREGIVDMLEHPGRIDRVHAGVAQRQAGGVADEVGLVEIGVIEVEVAGIVDLPVAAAEIEQQPLRRHAVEQAMEGGGKGRAAQLRRLDMAQRDLPACRRAIAGKQALASQRALMAPACQRDLDAAALRPQIDTLRPRRGRMRLIEIDLSRLAAVTHFDHARPRMGVKADLDLSASLEADSRPRPLDRDDFRRIQPDRRRGIGDLGGVMRNQPPFRRRFDRYRQIPRSLPPPQRLDRRGGREADEIELEILDPADLAPRAVEDRAAPDRRARRLQRDDLDRPVRQRRRQRRDEPRLSGLSVSHRVMKPRKTACAPKLASRRPRGVTSST